MTEKAEFQKILDYFCEKYDITYTQPFNDGYREFKMGCKEIGGFNSDGCSLCHNLHKLTKMIEDQKY